MADLSIFHASDRVIFPPGKQARFLTDVAKKTGMSWKELAKTFNIDLRLMSYYKNETYSIPFKLFANIISFLQADFPQGIEVRNQHWHKKIAGKIGGDTVFKKYGKIGGNSQYRNKQWEKWWRTKGHENPNSILLRKAIKFPKHSVDLAELCGILIGDGGISTYQMTITLNGETDRLYATYIVSILEKLFGVKPKIYAVNNSKGINISVSRRNLVEFLVGQGLKLGHKLRQRVCIPDWIMKSKTYRLACLKGLVDTDGSVVNERHVISGKEYQYPRLNFTSASPLLIQQVYQILMELKLKPKIRRGGKAVQVENIKEICQYFSIVGSSNPKHIERIGKRHQQNHGGVARVV